MLHIVAVYDKKAMSYFAPQTVKTVYDAMRGFEQAVFAGSGNLTLYPDDFNLQHVGTFDETTGALVAFEQREILLEARQCVKLSKDVEAVPSTLETSSPPTKGGGKDE